MKYSELYQKLKSVFDLNKPVVYLDDSEMVIHSVGFSSQPFLLQHKLPMGDSSDFLLDQDVVENNEFNYFIFFPSEAARTKAPIILLHGLNERSWLKYLPWAYSLAEKTDRAVILFPIAFHINRCPESWGNPRMLQQPLINRRVVTQADSLSSFANVTLSTRLSNQPLRFFASGQQSANDLLLLVKQLKTGQHPLFDGNLNPDFFAYSIGAFLAQILWLDNSEPLFEKSKLFLFCGGALFSQMNGFSKLIMDKEAYQRIYQFYMKELDDEIQNSNNLQQFFSENIIGKSFLNMLGNEEHTPLVKQRFHDLRNQISAIALKNDQVIPANAITDIIQHAEIIDFDYPYTHETPFPIGNDGIKQKADDAFEQIFEKATRFFK